KIKRGLKRGQYDSKTVHAIIDAALICHVGFLVKGRPLVISTCHWREGNKIYWHAHSKAQNVNAPTATETCLTITLLDGLVMARSAFNHSVNYRSVIIFGQPQDITDPLEKERQLKLMVDKFSPERWDQLRPITDIEVKATGVLMMDLDEVSCKVRSGPAVDEPEDVSWPVWAGVLPMTTEFGAAQENPDSLAAYEVAKLPAKSLQS
ncbi:MAG TPA: pyridoxamine 5'-phosphate oxidase family protein, partial [Oceanospirillaceae bacterium]|nr:pyridoxamine 5'-phosphate oxidase family protein [Oceanospirillaceae bacterium]